MGGFYWKRHLDGPFATLIRLAATYLHPEADDLESLQRLAKLGNDTRWTPLKPNSARPSRPRISSRATNCRNTSSMKTAVPRRF